MFQVCDDLYIHIYKYMYCTYTYQHSVHMHRLKSLVTTQNISHMSSCWKLLVSYLSFLPYETTCWKVESGISFCLVWSLRIIPYISVFQFTWPQGRKQSKKSFVNVWTPESTKLLDFRSFFNHSPLFLPRHSLRTSSFMGCPICWTLEADLSFSSKSSIDNLGIF